jgi:TRAP-type transport system small permease protein
MKDGAWVEKGAVIILEIAAALCFSALVVVVCLGVLDRFVLGVGWGWPEETARFLLIWGVFLAAAVCSKKGLHYSIDFFVVTFSAGKVRWSLEIFALAFSMIITCVFGWTGAILTYSERNQLSPALRIPMSFIYVAMPICAAFILLFLGIKLMEDMRIRKGEV